MPGHGFINTIGITFLFLGGAAFAGEPLECNVGPITVTVGGANWQVTSCTDGRSLVFATMKDNPAMPFVFIVQRGGEAARISGEGKGSKQHSAAAFEELEAMSEDLFDDLVQATRDADANRTGQ